MTFIRQTSDRQITDRQIAESQAYQLDQVEFTRDRSIGQSQGFRRTNDRVIQQMQGARRQQERLIRERIVGGSQAYLIGDREPLTGLYQAIPQDGGAPILGRKIFNAKANGQAVQVIDQGAGAVPALNAANTKEPTEAELLAEIQQYTRFGNCKGYFLGQVYNCEEPVIKGKGLMVAAPTPFDKLVIPGSRTTGDYYFEVTTNAARFYEQIFFWLSGQNPGLVCLLNPDQYSNPWNVSYATLSTPVREYLETLGYQITDEFKLEEVPSNSILVLPPMAILSAFDPVVTPVPQADIESILSAAQRGGVLWINQGIDTANQFTTRVKPAINRFLSDLGVQATTESITVEQDTEDVYTLTYGQGFRYVSDDGSPLYQLLADGDRAIPEDVVTNTLITTDPTPPDPWTYSDPFRYHQNYILDDDALEPLIYEYRLMPPDGEANFYVNGAGGIATYTSAFWVPPELL